MEMKEDKFRIEPMQKGRPVSDTMPRRGKVTDLCKTWLVHEDGALAYQLQQKEVQEHYSGNKSRNAIVREDFPKAQDAQREAEEEAAAEYYRQITQIEERDARVAREIAAKLHFEEEERRRRLEREDKFIAKVIHDKEKKSKSHLNKGDINAVGLPPVCSSASSSSSSVPPPLASRSKIDRVGQQLRRMQLHDSYDAIWPAPPDSDQISRAHQEKSDEELAKRLQLEEESLGLDMIDRDRLLAIEVQDMELAKMLQEKEKARLKRAKEKARARALAKRLEEQRNEESLAECSTLPPPPLPPLETVHNIATAIDPTYSPNKSLPSKMAPIPRQSPVHYQDHILYGDSSEDSPPYMPVQGQRRSSENKKKKKDSDCKQQ